MLLFPARSVLSNVRAHARTTESLKKRAWSAGPIGAAATESVAQDPIFSEPKGTTLALAAALRYRAGPLFRRFALVAGPPSCLGLNMSFLSPCLCIFS